MQIIASTLSADREVLHDDVGDSRAIYIRTSEGIEYTISEDDECLIRLALVKGGRSLRLAPQAANVVEIGSDR